MPLPLDQRAARFGQTKQNDLAIDYQQFADSIAAIWMVSNDGSNESNNYPNAPTIGQISYRITVRSMNKSRSMR